MVLPEFDSGGLAGDGRVAWCARGNAFESVYFEPAGDRPSRLFRRHGGCFVTPASMYFGAEFEMGGGATKDSSDAFPADRTGSFLKRLERRVHRTEDRLPALANIGILFAAHHVLQDAGEFRLVAAGVHQEVD